jgi:hypothetical protein
MANLRIITVRLVEAVMQTSVEHHEDESRILLVTIQRQPLAQPHHEAAMRERAREPSACATWERAMPMFGSHTFRDVTTDEAAI